MYDRNLIPNPKCGNFVPHLGVLLFAFTACIDDGRVFPYAVIVLSSYRESF